MKFNYEIFESRLIDNNILVIYDKYCLSETTSPKRWENVELFDKHGNKLWTVNGLKKFERLDKKRDTFVGIYDVDGNIQLIYSSGDVFKLDIATGNITL